MSDAETTTAASNDPAASNASTAASASAASSAAPLRRRALIRRVVQGVAFVVGIGLLAWCFSLALKPENREAIDKLMDAPWYQSGGVLALSVLSLLINGVLFWVTIRPVRPLPMLSVVATNGIASLMNYLPFKIGLAARFIIHNRRDGVPLLTIAAWLAAGAVGALAVFVPLTVASAWRQEIDWLWVLAGPGGVALCALAVWIKARLFARAPGMVRLHALARRTGLGALGLSWLLRTSTFGHLHHAFAMLADAKTLVAIIGLRLLDVAVNAARFHLAGVACGVAISWDTAILAACVHFVLGVVAPSGQLGMREGGMTGLAKLLTIPGVTTGQFAVVALVVGGAELLANLAVGAAGFAVVRPWRLGRRVGGETESKANAEAAGKAELRGGRQED